MKNWFLKFTCFFSLVISIAGHSANNSANNTTLFVSSDKATSVYQYENIDDLQNRIHVFLETYIENQLEQETFQAQETTVALSQIDPRLKLTACPDNALAINPQIHNQFVTNISVKVSCTAHHRWSIVIPAKIHRLIYIPVAASNIGKGKVITSTDIKHLRVPMDTLASSAELTEHQIIGKQARRFIRKSDVFRRHSLQTPNIVAKGDSLTLEATAQKLSVSAPAIAMSSGHLGQTIRVKNLKSNKIIHGIIVGPGRALTQ